jgi:hypothetical protein
MKVDDLSTEFKDRIKEDLLDIKTDNLKSNHLTEFSDSAENLFNIFFKVWHIT